MSSDATPDPIQQVLTAILAGYHVPQGRLDAEALATQHDPAWESLLAKARHERITPLIYRAVKEDDRWPVEFVEAAHQAYLQTAALSMLRSQELGSVLRCLGEAGIDVLVLKGMALAELVYGNLALRPMVDTDILLRKADLPHAIDALAGLGYAIDIDAADPAFVMAYENAITLSRPDTRTWFLELHWTLFDSPFHQERLTDELLWEQPVRFDLGGTAAAALQTELMLLHLCGHLLLHHHGRGLLWWNDIAELLNRDGERLDWQLLIRLAEDAGLIAVLQRVLSELEREWYVSLPDGVADQLKALVPSEKERMVVELMADGEPRAGRRFLVDLTSFSGSRDRLQFLRDNLLPSGDYMDRRYNIPHPGLRPLYYPYRWVVGLSSLGRRKPDDPA